MEHLPFGKEEFDLIWSEGAIYNIGFQRGLKEWREYIKPGGYIHCATDWENYAEQMLEVLQNEPLLSNLYDGYSPVMANPITERPMTKFHARGERLGHGVWDLVFKRK